MKHDKANAELRELTRRKDRANNAKADRNKR